MAFASEAARRFMAKLNNLLDKNIVVRLNNGRIYKGVLVGFDPNTLSLALEKAIDNEENSWPIAIVRGESVSEILIEQGAIFDAKEFAEFIVKVGNIPAYQVRVYDDINVVEVARSVRVSKDGVEGAGPLAHRLNSLFREYLRRKGVRVQ
jgi:small nuclear ribonucleoprotein (snRNP)-like protein